MFKVKPEAVKRLEEAKAEEANKRAKELIQIGERRKLVDCVKRDICPNCAKKLNYVEPEKYFFGLLSKDTGFNTYSCECGLKADVEITDFPYRDVHIVTPEGVNVKCNGAFI